MDCQPLSQMGLSHQPSTADQNVKLLFFFLKSPSAEQQVLLLSFLSLAKV